ncbi:HU family DNA-binding protein [Parabacteroides sp. FAFU027]|uniref:HU family DNA-binding protein n=1 Tax=Parabacteroides sp. FAFU027 TaxID=2922715 RepID=UPI00293E7068|nr:HU family DNA-binding protein [Parabacteroides sp. FAFU027]
MLNLYLQSSKNYFLTLIYTIVMNKQELIDAMAEKAGISKADSKKALDAFTAVVAEELKKEGKVALVGFGTFSVVEKSARTGINPATKQQIQIAAKKVAKFKPGADLDIQ